VEGILAQGLGTLRDRLSLPNELRPAGFGLRTGLPANVLPGGGLRIIDKRLSLSLERNGLLTLIAAADSDYLAWADVQRGRKNGLLSTALIECTLEFVRLFCGEVLPRCRPTVEEWAITGGMSDLIMDDPPTALSPGRHQWGSSDLTLQPVSQPGFSLKQHVIRDESPGRVAYRVLRDVYAEFGIDETKIPFVADGEVSDEQILSIKVP
jgi:hypothetical protein